MVKADFIPCAGGGGGYHLRYTDHHSGILQEVREWGQYKEEWDFVTRHENPRSFPFAQCLERLDREMGGGPTKELERKRKMVEGGAMLELKMMDRGPLGGSDG